MTVHEQHDPMSRDEVVLLLRTIAHYDNRPPSVETTDAWLMSAQLAGWKLAEAVAAVHHHFAFSTDYLKPGHITALIQQARQKPRIPLEARTVAQALPAPEQPPAEPERVRSIVEQLANRLGWERTKRPDPATSPVECPVCQALPGKPCVRRQHRGPHKGRYVPLAKPHPSRVELERGTTS
ncbi:hypothetical protein JOF41_007310 [Saccharothrix coeruleofusca]|uniref:zinc finger domain-containing protein n=1 Tax=Saccharothrix coeruleofusca TaxID=33919 RepID=UPI001AEA8F2D|nr:hypothetical protein [Saccharothrix coeruleofusca]MBP2341056.1 hypothetical protein [Saccharothrix coeruleofusca]